MSSSQDIPDLRFRRARTGSGGEEETTTKHGDSIQASSVRSAYMNIMTQVTFRIITFVLNAFVLRHISRDVMGIINVRLNLLDDTILFLSREGLRLACLSHNKEKPEWRGVLNLMWLCVPISMVWAPFLGYLWAYYLPQPQDHLIPQYHEAVFMVATGGVVQMFAEVPYLVGQILLFIRLRVALDFIWMMIRTVILVVAVIFYPEEVVQVWAYGNFLAAVVYTLGFYFSFYLIIKYGGGNSDQCQHRSSGSEVPFTSLTQLLPAFTDGTYHINKEYSKVARGFMGQGVMKQLLTEGEKYVVTVFNLLTLSQQGIYDVVCNLGSLAARFVFRPVEESAFFFFTQMWSRGAPIHKQDPHKVGQVVVGLYRLLRLMVLIGLVVVLFGFSYADLLLFLYGGTNLIVGEGGGTNLLRAQCLLVLLLAVNGITECFARSVMTDVEINKYNGTMVFMSIAYLVFTWMFTKVFGPVGLVFANCLNMALRIGFAIQVIQSTFKPMEEVKTDSIGKEKVDADESKATQEIITNFSRNSPLEGLRPDKDLVFMLFTVGCCCQVSELYLYPWSRLAHFLLGGCLFLLTIATIVLKEEFILQAIVSKVQSFFGRNKEDEDNKKKK